MSDEIFLEGKNYVSSKKAALTSGYAQDYIGQLARSGAIDAQRVGGLWYVSMDSLSGYQRNAASYTPTQPVKSAQELDSVVSFDGKEYVSAARGAKITGYNQDYIGQLARGGKILSRQIGNRWYVEKEGLVGHKNEKDKLLAAVQAESVGLLRSQEAVASPLPAAEGPLLNYFNEQKDLIPTLIPRDQQKETPASSQPGAPEDGEAHAIPIRVVRPVQRTQKLRMPPQPKILNKRVKNGGNTIYRAAEAGVALTFVLVLSYGLFSLKDGSIYAVGQRLGTSAIASSALAANTSSVFEQFSAFVEKLIVPEMIYVRSN